MRQIPNKFGVLLIFMTLTFWRPEMAHSSRFVGSELRPYQDIIEKARTYGLQGQSVESAKLLMPAIETEKDKEKRALLHMSLGLIYFQNSKDAEAEAAFKKALEDGLRISDYASFYLGLLEKKKGNLKEAKAELDKVVSGMTPPQTEYQAKMRIGEILMEQKQWRAAVKHYQNLKRKMRSSQHYPEIVYQLLRAEKKSGNSAASCRHARELFSRFPAYSEIRDWGASLEKNMVDGERVGCLASSQDLKTRVRRLWLSGEADRASSELRILRQSSVGDDESIDSNVDYMLANHLISEGQVEEALKILLRNYEAKRNSIGYLMLLGKAASRAGEYQAAIAAYQRAYDIAPNGRKASNALFTSAFTSYQIQDYDGASRRFEQFVKKYPRSKLARDSNWYLAWIKYLRGDYSGAYESFTKLAKAPRGGRRRGTGEAMTDRLRYWSAVSLMKMNRTSEATPIFQSLVRDPAIGYYSVVAYYRLLSIPGAKLPAGVEAHLGMKKADTSVVPTEEEIQAAAEAVEEARQEFENQQGPQEVEIAGSDGEAVEENGENQIAGELPQKEPGTFKVRFERARDLLLVGLQDAARAELREIEKHARSAADRRRLMIEYVEVGNYDRASFLGEVGFGVQRVRGGLRGDSRQLWEFAYPRAYEKAVETASKSTGVAEELIWGIMRAESHFKYDAHSPVGALGLMQLMPFTGRQVAGLLNLDTFEVNSLLDPETNIRLGSRYLQRLVEKFSGSIPLVAASYNAGPHRAHAWVRNFGSLDMDAFIEHIPFMETRNYVKKVSRNYQIYSLLYGGEKNSLKWLVQPVAIRLSDPAPTKEIW